MASIVITSDTPYLLSPANGKQTVITNTDPENDIIIGPEQGIYSAQSAGITGGVINDPNVTVIEAAGGSMTFDGTQEVWGLCVPISGDVTATVSIQEGASAITPGAITTADALVTSGFALEMGQAVAQAIGQGGVSLVSPITPLFNVTQLSTTSFPPGQFGCTIAGNYSTQALADQQLTTFNGLVKRNSTCRKIYTPWLQGQPALTALDQHTQSCVNLNQGVYINFRPNPTNLNTADGNAIVTSCNNLHALGLKIIAVLLWQEPQFNNNPMGASNPTGGAMFQAMQQFYYPIIHAGGYRVVTCHEGYHVAQNTAQFLTAYDPGAAFQDGILVDFYGASYQSGKRIDSVFSLALSQNKPVGVGEMNTANRQATLTTAEGTAYLTYLDTLADNQLTANGAIEAFMWYENNTGSENPNETISLTTDFRIPLLQAINDDVVTATTGGGGGTTINPGTTLTLTPLNPVVNEPTYAPALGFSYDCLFLLKAGASSTSPFARINFNWQNQTLLSGTPVSKQSWICPMGPSTSANGTLIRGRGPMHGNAVSVAIKNLDSVACTIQTVINQTGRTSSRHDLRWDSGQNPAPPGFTLANGADDSVEYVTTGPVPLAASTGTASQLFSLYCGQVTLFFKVTGAAANNTVKLTLIPVPSSEFSTSEMFTAFLPVSASVITSINTISLGRGAYLATLTNNDANAVTAVVTMTPTELVS